MTKQWDVYEATIKDLYAENTLSVVRQMMIDQYGFKASVRAYRGRLIRWGIRKYNCRKRASSSSSGSGSSINDGIFPSGLDTTSPPMAAVLPHGVNGHLAMPPQINQQPAYDSVGGRQTRIYSTDKSYDIKPKPQLSPPHGHLSNSNSNSSSTMNFTWDTASPPLPRPKRLSNSSTSSTSVSDFDGFTTTPPTSHSHSYSHNHGGGSAEIMAPPTYFGGHGVLLSNTRYLRHVDGQGRVVVGGGGGGGGGGGYYDGPAHRDAHAPGQGQGLDGPRGEGEGLWA
ncbi:hypothetical protein F4781DRAFT_254932 [Annulohypoxylon bovei var. microspora]|nr:hypothetical protein F4781DRAFT_254932 [Annulohypoxylon bovei var. microspora]